ncbi:MAG: hypothetical protein ACJ74U_04725 [Jatrophihabitantaceae bacterium]
MLPSGTAARELLAVSAQFFGAQALLDGPTDLGRGESRTELVARTRALCATRGQPIALGFGEAGGIQYLGAALEHGRFDATAVSLFGGAIATWFQAGLQGRQPAVESAADSSASVAISERSVGAWRRALNVVGGIARCDPPASAPCGIYLRLPRSAGQSTELSGGERGGGLVPVLDAIGQALGRGRSGVPRLVGVTGSNRQYPDLANFAGMAAQPGPIVLDDAVTSPNLSNRTRSDLLRRRLLIALRSARWCPNCLDAEFGRFDSTLCEFFTETLVVNDTRLLELELADVLDQVPNSQPVELADWPFHPGGSAFALATDAAGDLIFALRSSSRALSGIEPADFLAHVSANLRFR